MPTERCRELIPIIDRILAEAETMEDQGNFDPSKSTAQISIICATFGLRVVLSNVLKRVRQLAPGIKVDLLERYHGVSDYLQEGKADIALTVTDIDVSGIYSHSSLITDFSVCIMDPQNPLAGKALTEKDIQDAKHIATRLWANWVQPFEMVAENLGIKLDQVISVTNPAQIPTLLRETDLLAVVPGSLARTYENQLGIAQLPFKVPVSLNMHWPAAANRSNLSIWIRGIIIEEADKVSRVLNAEH